MKNDNSLDNICEHISRLLSGKVRQNSINVFVNRALPFDRKTQFSYFKNASAMFSNLLLEQPLSAELISCFNRSLRIDNLNDLKLKELLKENTNNKYFPNNIFFFDVFNYLKNKPNHERFKILSGLSNLHSFFLPDKSKINEYIEKIKNTIQCTKKNLEYTILDSFRQEAQLFSLTLLKAGFVDTKIETTDLETWSMGDKSKSYDPHAKQALGRDRLSHYSISRICKSNKDIADLFNNNPREFLAYTLRTDITELGNKKPVKFKGIKHRKPIGVISLLPSPKDKYRPIAIPNLVLSTLNYPLSRKLQNYGKIIKNHGMYGHNKSSKSIMNSINNVDNNYSIDYSSFTDFFPYELQRILLEELRNHNLISQFDIDVMDIICNGDYLLSHTNETLKYSVGTPQGTYASFPLASITHMLIGCMLWREIDPSYHYPQNIPLHVTGDDSVILNDQLYLKMMTFMNKINVPINLDKTLISKKFVEYCSKYITSNFVYIRKKPRQEDKSLTFERIIDDYFYYYDNHDGLKDEIKNIPFPFGLKDIPEHQLYIESSIDDYFLFKRLSQWNKILQENLMIPTKNEYKILFRKRSINSDLFEIDPDHNPFLLSDNNSWFKRNIKSLTHKNIFYDRLSLLFHQQFKEMVINFTSIRDKIYRNLQQDITSNITVSNQELDDFLLAHLGVITQLHQVYNDESVKEHYENPDTIRFQSFGSINEPKNDFARLITVERDKVPTKDHNNSKSRGGR